MVKLVYTLGLGSNPKRVGVQVPSPVRKIHSTYSVYSKKVCSSGVEQWTFNPKALGSIPNILNFYMGNILGLTDIAIAF